ncbi:hypothetical protein E1265_27575 [Streptomyces sp. 8K308]|uniref:hypothetical protein n=1 Tax=Streptomyces sp. 8K308 TaxID=2530388 RepID=UPI00104FD846|nr:hypothetical protein [Streptomyces sp. 8K308]TDC13655.1 hypothetical protein E1265_27575 [Streptomyces sp. 8K308]
MTGSVRRAGSGWGARVARSAAAALALFAMAGCGIRSTDVPVDAGPAPTRTTCDAPAEVGGAGLRTEVYLVCGSRVNPVERAIELPADTTDRIAVATALLDELQSDPGREERAAGFSSEVPDDLDVSGPAANDPAEALRLNKRPGDLPAAALGQIVCTFAHSDSLGNGGTVMLGGPVDSPHGGQPKRYRCSTAMWGIGTPGLVPPISER